ncbi:MAG TPA: hypothetical protein VHS54_00745, partial [Jatrophihabitans sp.]|nr:hypothetical protein [Jatrophihabitans sp.]
MNDTPVPSRLRRLSLIVLIFAVLVQVAVAVATAPAATAAPCLDCPGDGGGGGGTAWHSVTTITPPAVGSVNVVQGQTLTQSCSAGNPSGCTIDDALVGTDRPTSAWPSYTLAYAGPTGYANSWTGRCSGTGVCTFSNDQEASSVVAHSFDVQPPTVSVVAPARVSPTATIHANATDNVGISSYSWSVCAPDGTACLAYEDGSQLSTISLPGQAAGDHVVRVRVLDPSGNEAYASAHVTLVNAVSMTWTTLPALTEHPSFTFHSDDEAHVPADAAHRRCRVYPTGTAAGDWGACTTDTSFAPTLADGNWTLQAEEIDDLGLIGITPAQQTTVDTAAPVLAFTDAPTEGGTVATTSASFGFTVSDRTLATVTCQLDAAAAGPCTSPYLVSGYVNGQHSATVTATDQLGHTTTLVRTFSVAVPTTVQPKAAAVTVTYGHAATLAVTVAPLAATGTVRFVTSTGSTLCTATVRAGVASCVTSAGLTAAGRTITARYTGNYTASATQFR